MSPEKSKIDINPVKKTGGDKKREEKNIIDNPEAILFELEKLNPFIFHVRDDSEIKDK